MEMEEFINKVGKAGTYAQVTWQKIIKTPAKSDLVVVKQSTATVRAGIEFQNLAQNSERVTGPLPWGVWLVKPWVITHKGGLYFRLYLTDGWKVKQAFTIGGKPATKLEAQAVTLASEWPKPTEEAVKTFTVKAEGVLAVN
jgi:hypothetical protein